MRGALVCVGVAGLLLGGGCTVRIPDAVFSCRIGQVGTCPSGWVCECRGAGCTPRCYAEAGTYCGDGVLNGAEECEGTDFGGATCESLGLGGGVPICTKNCTIYCTVCGNGVVEVTEDGTGEQCDDGALNSDAPDARCRSDCTLQRCGDGIIDTGLGEQCEGQDLGNMNCEAMGFYGGTLSCDNCQLSVANCAGWCGDGVLNGQEACDGHDFGPLACTDAAYDFYGGTLTCSGDCQQILTTACTGRCGDGVIDAAFGEQCDGANIGDVTCVDLGYYHGTPGCTAGCRFDTQSCSGRCGDGHATDGEDCDLGDGTHPDLGGKSCTDFGFYYGTLSCTNVCSFLTSGCSGYCTDGVLDPGEVCDTVAPAGESCLTYGYDAGRLGCTDWCTPGFDACRSLGWKAMVSNTDQDLNGVWGSGAADVFAVGWSGAVVHYNGSVWAPMTPVTSNSLWAVWGSATTNVVAVGDAGTALAWNGSAWRTTATGVTRTLLGVWGSGAGDVFAVGEHGTILHSNGTAWQPMASGVTTWLNAVWGASPTSVYAVGNSGTVLLYNGSAWTAIPPATTGAGGGESFYAVWGDGDSSVFVAGITGGALGTDRFLHWNGTSWSVVTGGALTPRGLWGPPGAEVYATGCGVRRYNGQGWANMAVPAAIPDSYCMQAIWGSSARDVFTVGLAGKIFHYEGNGWLAVKQESDYLGALFGTSLQDVYAVAGASTYHYNGNSWTPLAGVPAGLSGLWGTGPQDLVGVTPMTGSDGGVSGPPGQAFRYDGTSWVTTALPGQPVAVWGRADNDIFAVGFDGVLHFDGSSWRSVDGTPSLVSVAGTSGANVFAVGDGGVVIHYNGTSWDALASGTSAYLTGVWAFADGSAVAVGTGGTAVHFDGHTWTPGATGTGADLQAVWGSAKDDVFAVGDAGTVLYYDGTGWSPVRETFGLNGRAVWGSGRQVFIIGDPLDASSAGAIITLVRQGPGW